jgi:hypothetical protein
MSDSTEVTIPSEEVKIATKLEAPAIVDRLLEIEAELTKLADDEYSNAHNNIRFAAQQLKVAIGYFVTLKK